MSQIQHHVPVIRKLLPQKLRERINYVNQQVTGVFRQFIVRYFTVQLTCDFICGNFAVNAESRASSYAIVLSCAV